MNDKRNSGTVGVQAKVVCKSMRLVEEDGGTVPMGVMAGIRWDLFAQGRARVPGNPVEFKRRRSISCKVRHFDETLLCERMHGTDERHYESKGGDQDGTGRKRGGQDRRDSEPEVLGPVTPGLREYVEPKPAFHGATTAW